MNPSLSNYYATSLQKINQNLVSVKDEPEPITDTGDFSYYYSECPKEATDISQIKPDQHEITIDEAKLLQSGASEENDGENMLNKVLKVEHVFKQDECLNLSDEKAEYVREKNSLTENFEEKPKVAVKSEFECCDVNSSYYNDDCHEKDLVKQEAVKGKLSLIENLT